MSVDIGSGLLLIAFLLGLLAIGLWVPFALMVVALVAMVLFTSVPAGEVFASSIWGGSTDWALAALPMFIWMGELLTRSKLSQNLFSGLAPLLTWLPGRLLHINVLGSGLFAAVSGSSAATCATVGKMALPELRRRGYDDQLAIGALAGSATLGFLIPPSIILIVYGAAVEESIARLFVAGVLPGLLVLGLFTGYVAIWATLYPGRVPPAEPSLPFAEKLRSASRLVPPVLLIVGVIGSIYTGIASPTDAAAVGVGLTLLMTWVMGDLDLRMFWDSLMAATRTTCMIAFILAGAACLTAAMGFSGIPRSLAEWVGGFDLDTYTLIAALTLLFVLLGCFLDGLSIIVLTAAVIVPIVEGAGIDLIWFGIYLVLVVEISQITPPVGFNLFVLQSLTGRSILSIAASALPFFCLLLVAVIILVAFPSLATFLPQHVSLR